MKNLTFYDTTPFDELAWPERNNNITLDSSALEVFTDFNQIKPLVIESSISAIDAEKLMQKAHVHLKIVVDSNNHFLGIVSLEDLNCQEILKRISKGDNREELSVTDFMRRRKSLKAVDYSELEKASIDTVIGALKSNNQQHCLVIDREQHKIRGIISARDIARKLHLPLNIASDSTFVGIFQAVLH
ncbi:MAG: CBS domain-containing protein [Cycloclasticus sp.]|nr:CBS domain-containing protein [Cycloclasticus sp.]